MAALLTLSQQIPSDVAKLNQVVFVDMLDSKESIWCGLGMLEGGLSWLQC